MGNTRRAFALAYRHPSLPPFLLTAVRSADQRSFVSTAGMSLISILVGSAPRYGDHPALRHQPAQMFGDNRAAASDQRFIRVEELVDGQLPRLEQKLVVLGLPAMGVAIPIGLVTDGFQQVGEVINIDRAGLGEGNRGVFDLEVEAAIIGDEQIGGQADGLFHVIGARDTQKGR